MEMDRHTEKHIYQKASKSFDCLNKAIQAFIELLREDNSSSSSNYYRARSYLRDGEALYKETLKDAKKLMGPIPEYASQEFEKWRSELLEKNNVLAKSLALKDLRSELGNDEFLIEWMSIEEIDAFLEESFQAQQTGKRKLSNIKVRMILDKLEKLISEANELKKKAMEKQQVNV